MNKKLFLSMFVAAGMLLATSCSNDELDVVQSGNEAQVTFSLAAEGGIATRAISDGKTANKLVYAVFDSEGIPLSVFDVDDDGTYEHQKTETISDIVTNPHEVTITLAKGQTYQVAFWAQNESCTAYTTTDLRNVVVNYAGNNNDETRDAFFKMVEFEVAGDKSIDVVMKRPFAQINVGVTAEDWDAAVASGIEIKNSDVVIKNAATSINLLTGEISGEQDVTYTINAIPGEKLMVDADGDGTKEAYHWLSMSYILVNDTHTTDEDSDGTIGDNRTNLESLAYTFTPEIGNAIAFTEGLNNVPVQRNWRTNILGKILTGDIQFNITIDPVYDGDIIYTEAIGSAQVLEMTATFGGTFTQTEDINFGEEGLDIQADFIYNIEDGKTLTSGSAANYGIRVLKGTTTINGGNGNIDSKGGGIGVVNGAEVIFNGGNLDINTESTSGRYLFYLAGEGSTVTINGGNFDFNRTQNQKRAYIYASPGTVAYVNGGTFGKASTRDGYTDGIMGEGTVIITGGTFGFDPSNWVATGYKVLPSGSNFVVVSNDIDAVASSGAELKSAIASGNANIVLAEDITYGAAGTGYYIYKDAFINLNNNTFEATYSFRLNNNADLTMIGGDYVANDIYGHVDVRPTTAVGSVVTFEDVNFSYNYKNGSSYNRLGTVVKVTANVADANTKLLFKNCTFNNAAVLFEGLSGVIGTFEAVFENCTFNALTSSAPVYVRNFVTGTIKMTGCTFNLDCTDTSASAIFISHVSSTNVTVTAENNTINAVAATTGVDNIRFIYSYENTTVNETGTVKTGIAI